jgi:hypothetical protein
MTDKLSTASYTTANWRYIAASLLAACMLGGCSTAQVHPPHSLHPNHAPEQAPRPPIHGGVIPSRHPKPEPLTPKTLPDYALASARKICEQ